jgi:hypothetical protein
MDFETERRERERESERFNGLFYRLPLILQNENGRKPQRERERERWERA